MLSLNLLLPGWNTACLDSDAISNHSQRRFKSSVKSGLTARLQHESPSRVFEERTGTVRSSTVRLMKRSSKVVRIDQPERASVTLRLAPSEAVQSSETMAVFKGKNPTESFISLHVSFFTVAPKYGPFIGKQTDK